MKGEEITKNILTLIYECFSDIVENKLGEKGYILDVNKDGVTIKAAGETGPFYGIQSMRQLLPASLEDGTLDSRNIMLPMLHIQDAPKYSWRGNMIDFARSFFGKDYLKKHLDRMVLYKMNRLWPRLIAVAEIGWSPSHDDFKDFTRRLRAHKSRLDALKIEYFPAAELN